MKYPELPTEASSAESWQRGLELLRKPAWPLCNMAVLLYLTGPYDRFQDLLSDLPDELEVASITYQAPAKILTTLLKFLNIFETLKYPERQDEDKDIFFSHSSPPRSAPETAIKILTGSSEADPFDAATARAKHNIIDHELDQINSLFCAPCKCTLCCTGPSLDAEQEFFEIPLSPQETALFDLSETDSPESRQTNPYAEKPLKIDQKLFYSLPPALYHWENGWSMILTKGSSCPALSEHGACSVYPKRPVVCRKPQIFSGIMEYKGGATYTIENRLIAVQDCPYVRALTDELSSYAALNEADLVFRSNKR